MKAVICFDLCGVLVHKAAGLHADGSHRPVEGREEAAGGQHEGSLRQQGPSVIHPVQVPSGHVSHADRSGRTVQEFITVPTVDRRGLLEFMIHLTDRSSRGCS